MCRLVQALAAAFSAGALESKWGGVFGQEFEQLASTDTLKNQPLPQSFEAERGPPASATGATCVCVCVYTHANSLTHTRTHARTHTQTHAHTHTHTHTHRWACGAYAGRGGSKSGARRQGSARRGIVTRDSPLGLFGRGQDNIADARSRKSRRPQGDNVLC